MAKKTKKTKAPAAAKAAAPVAAALAPAAVTKTVAAPAAAPAASAVSARAHQIWIARGKPSPGTPLEDWLQAERELGSPRKS